MNQHGPLFCKCQFSECPSERNVGFCAQINRSFAALSCFMPAERFAYRTNSDVSDFVA